MTTCSRVGGYQHSEGRDWRKWVFVSLFLYEICGSDNGIDEDSGLSGM